VRYPADMRRQGGRSFMATSGCCPLTQRQMLDEYFIEHRTKILDIAAFLDRFDRASIHDAEEDFRMVAFRAALEVLAGGAPGAQRLHAIQMILSDPRSELREHLDQQSASGAYGRDG
jgi:hypothetical protein